MTEPKAEWQARDVIAEAIATHDHDKIEDGFADSAGWMDALRNAKKENVSLPAVLKLKPEKDKTWPMVEVDQ